jgi:hypothetical protein
MEVTGGLVPIPTTTFADLGVPGAWWVAYVHSPSCTPNRVLGKKQKSPTTKIISPK